MSTHKIESQVFIRYFENAKDEEDRLWSWDICYEAFRREESEDTLALHLAFYLASWGMYRGSGGLLQKNYKVHRGTIEILKKSDYECLWCDNYREVTTINVKLIFELKKELEDFYSSKPFQRGLSTGLYVNPTSTLISKILLGTMSCLPAYDQYFIDGLKICAMKNKSFNKKSVRELFEFTAFNSPELKEEQNRIRREYRKNYPLMKLVDIYFWQVGYEKSIKIDK